METLNSHACKKSVRVYYSFAFLILLSHYSVRFAPNATKGISDRPTIYSSYTLLVWIMSRAFYNATYADLFLVDRTHNQYDVVRCTVQYSTVAESFETDDDERDV